MVIYIKSSSYFITSQINLIIRNSKVSVFLPKSSRKFRIAELESKTGYVLKGK